jgi:DNA-binding response OmpR family regulator
MLAPAEMMTAVNHSNIEVLVVEDDPELGPLVAQTLTQAGHPAHRVRNGDDALSFLTTAVMPPRVILLDLHMPGLNGWDFISVIRSYPKLTSIPVIVVSGFPPGDAENYPRVSYMTKPVDLRALLNMVKRHTPRAAEPATRKLSSVG